VETVLAVLSLAMAAALSPDARWLAEGLQDGQVLLRDLGGR